MKTLYVHIGTPKTGTSSIQHFCVINRKVLRKYGYSYPKTFHVYPRMDRARNGMFLHTLVYDEKGGRDKAAEERIFQDGLVKLQSEFLRFKTVVLSDEVIWMSVYKRRESLWEELLEEGKKGGFVVKAVVYLRRQDEYISSWWNQMVKKRRVPLTTPWEEYRESFPANLQPDYDHALSRIAAVIGRENLIVRRFERDHFYGGSLEADFLNAIGLELTPQYQPVGKSYNAKLAGNTHEIKRVLNTLGNIHFAEDEFFREALRDYTDVAALAYPASVLSKAETEAFVQPYLEGNRRIAREYFGEDSDLFDMTFEDTMKWEKDNPYMLDDVVRMIGATSRRLLDTLRVQKEEFREVRGRMKKLEARLRELEKIYGALQT